MWIFYAYLQPHILVSGGRWAKGYVEASTPTTKQLQEERSKILHQVVLPFTITSVNSVCIGDKN